MIITENTTLNDFLEYEATKDSARYIVGCADKNLFMSIAGDSLKKMNEGVPQWGLKDLMFGLQHYVDTADKKISFFHSIYSAEEIAEEPQKEDVKLFFFPAAKEKKKSDHYVLLCSGGAYRNVCNPQEAFPVAARLNELGITAFALDYRTWSPETSKNGVVAYALKDVAAALSYIDQRADEFGVKAGAYAMGGFSAGGNLTALWGIKNRGYKKYNCNKPELLLLDYAFVLCEPFERVTKEVKEFYKVFAGEVVTKDKIDALNVVPQVDKEYPPTVLVQCEDDELVVFNNWLSMKNALESNNVPFLARSAKNGGHGYGLGLSTDLNGWVDDAVDFWFRESR